MPVGQVPAAERTVAVLRFLASQPRPVPAAAIARELGLPRSSTYHLLAVLERERFVTHLLDERSYGLGVAAFEIGTAYLRHEGLERLSRPLLARLVAATGQVGHVGVLDGRELLYLVKEMPPAGELLVTDVGVRLPAHLTASGRALLAHLPAAQVAALFPSGQRLGTRTGRGPSTAKELRRLLAATRARGWATEDSEVTDGFASVAAASFDHTGRPVASLALTSRWVGPADDDPVEVAGRVVAAAAALTGRLRGHEPAGAR